MCNALVCMAVWLCYSARSTTDKILAIIFPISAFVAAGFEHSIANMYFIPIGLLIKQFAPASFWAADALAKATPAAITIDSFAKLTWGNFFLNNLIPVTIGNIVGGAGLVGGGVLVRLSADEEILTRELSGALHKRGRSDHSLRPCLLRYAC